jgi:glucose dehydrogenase
LPASASGRGANWEYINFDANGTNFNPQNQINKENVQALELKWTYSIPANSAPAVNIEGYYGVRFHEGSTTPPIIVNGTVYIITNYYLLVALDASEGKVLWTYQYEADLAEARKTLPLAGVAGHLHGFYYMDANLVFPGIKCDVIAVNALTGKLSWTLEDVCSDVQGNSGLYGGVFGYPPALYRNGNILIVQSSLMDGIAGRGFVAGYDYSSKQLRWRFYTAPPAGGDADWAVKVRDKVWIQGIKATEIPLELLKNDWGDLGMLQFSGWSPWGAFYDNRISRAGTGTVWGQMAVDEETGIVYLGVSQATPGYNATFRPGPNLFSDSVIALDARNGKLVWAHQTTTHDLWDWDCGWNVVLGKIDSRKVIFKACKNGILYAFNASTGEMIWHFNAPSFRRSDFTPFHANSKLNSGPKDGSAVGNWDPRNPETFQRRWQNWPSKESIWQNPTANGGVESDIAYDSNAVYVATYNFWGYLQVSNTDGIFNLGGFYIQPTESRRGNTTIWAVDAATGKPKWSYHIDGVGHRGGLTVSGGVLYVASPDGNLYALETGTGKLLLKRYFGEKLNIPPTIGANKEGRMLLFQVVGGTAFANTFNGAIGAAVPGALMVFGLPEKIKPLENEPPKNAEETSAKVDNSAIVYLALIVTVVALSVLLMRKRKK